MTARGWALVSLAGLACLLRAVAPAAAESCDSPRWIRTAPGAQGVDTARLNALAHDLAVARWAHYLPSLSVAVFRGDRVVAHGARGWANVHQRACATTDTVYPTASLLKPMVATALLERWFARGWTLDTPVRTACDLLGIRVKRIGEDLRVLDLLSHSTSVVGGQETSQPQLWTDTPPSLEDQLAAMEVGLLPGTAYSNDAYTIAGALLARLCAPEGGADCGPLVRQFERAMSERVFEPLSMGSTAIRPDGALQERMAQGYVFGSFEYRPKQRTRFASLPAAECYTTPTDYAAFLLRAAAVRPAAPGAPESTWERAVRTTRVQRTGAPGAWSFAPGWGVRRDDAQKATWCRHFGEGVSGRSVALMVVPDDPSLEAWGIVIQSNGPGYGCASDGVVVDNELTPPRGDVMNPDDAVLNELFERAEGALRALASVSATAAPLDNEGADVGHPAKPGPGSGRWFVELFDPERAASFEVVVEYDGETGPRVVWVPPDFDGDAWPTLAPDLRWDPVVRDEGGSRAYVGHSSSRSSTVRIVVRPVRRGSEQSLLDGRIEETLAAGVTRGRQSRTTLFVAARTPGGRLREKALTAVQGRWVALEECAGSPASTAVTLDVVAADVRLLGAFPDAPDCGGRVNALAIGALRAILRRGVRPDAPPPRILMWYFPAQERLVVAGRSPGYCRCFLFGRAG